MKSKPIVLNATILPIIAAFAVNTALGSLSIPISSAENVDRELERAPRMERVKKLEKFFEVYNSPLKVHSETFVKVAEKYGLDYRLLPAISCMESSCGKQLIEGSYNPFGWGIYGNSVKYFKSYDEAIEVVGKGLKDNYVEKGFDTPAKIAPIYTPPNHRNWLSGVSFFISKIDSTNKTDKNTLN